jgi:UDP-N-acetylmuramoyl-tripeptide--D-alanyl-D-alanine ligase
MEIDKLYRKFKACSSISTDTRKLSNDCMYFALKGENFDGNKFVTQAFEGGAKYCIIDDKKAAISANCILVEDTLFALQKLATYHRKEIGIPIIALTGSNGKTTTKELINAVLASAYNVKATIGNLNNHIGVPLTLLSFKHDLDFGIVEMGANHQKEIEFLCGIALPDFGLITNFGKAHLEGFGNIEGIIKGKTELYDFLREHNRIAFINTDDEKQITQIGEYSKTITFGKALDNDCIVRFEKANPFVTINYNDNVIDSQLIGDYNYNNIAVAIAIGKHFGVSTKRIKTAIENYKPDNNRSEIIDKGTINIILDAYNANPSSMLAALKNFKQLDVDNKYLFLGDMFELGDEAEKEHQSIVEYLKKNFKNNIFLIGENFFKTKTEANILKFSNFEDLKPMLKKIKLSDANLLIKGSRGMALERILDFI